MGKLEIRCAYNFFVVFIRIQVIDYRLDDLHSVHHNGDGFSHKDLLLLDHRSSRILHSFKFVWLCYCIIVKSCQTARRKCTMRTHRVLEIACKGCSLQGAYFSQLFNLKGPAAVDPEKAVFYLGNNGQLLDIASLCSCAVDSLYI